MRSPQTGGTEAVSVGGILAFVALLSAGYYYHLTFVQLGLIDLGTRLVGMSASNVSTVMAVLRYRRSWSPQ